MMRSILILVAILWSAVMQAQDTVTVSVNGIPKWTTYVYPDTVIVHDTTVITIRDTVYLPSPCDTVSPPSVPSGPLRALYVSPIEDWIGNPSFYLSWAKKQGVEQLNLYARIYLQSSTNRVKLAAFIKQAKEQYGIKSVTVDYRLTTEIQYWQTYHNAYKGTTSAIDGMLTEREPYVTGDYAGFWPFLRDGSKFAKANKIDLICYMGHPTDQAWDSIVFYCDKVYLSLYITMETWNNTTNGYNFAKGRWEKITNSVVKQGKSNYPVAYITSLEKKDWGARNDFMGDWYIGHSFYGSTWDTLLRQYNANSTQTIKDATELIGCVIFYSKYGLLARP